MRYDPGLRESVEEARMRLVSRRIVVDIAIDAPIENSHQRAEAFVRRARATENRPRLRDVVVVGVSGDVLGGTRHKQLETSTSVGFIEGR